MKPNYKDMIEESLISCLVWSSLRILGRKLREHLAVGTLSSRYSRIYLFLVLFFLVRKPDFGPKKIAFLSWSILIAFLLFYFLIPDASSRSFCLINGCVGPSLYLRHSIMFFSPWPWSIGFIPWESNCGPVMKRRGCWRHKRKTAPQGSPVAKKCSFAGLYRNQNENLNLSLTAL